MERPFPFFLKYSQLFIYIILFAIIVFCDTMKETLINIYQGADRFRHYLYNRQKGLIP
jgi:hypothetical protein